MRFSFVISAGLGYNIPNLFLTDLSFAKFEDGLRLLKEHGFSGVELNLATTNRRTLSRIMRSIRQEGLKLAAIGTGLLHLKNGYSLADRNPTRRERAVSAVNQLIGFASGEEAIVIIGLIRGGTLDGSGSARFREALLECDSAASEQGVQLALEAINRYESSSLNTGAEVVATIRDEKLRSTGILLDTFHMNIEEASIERAIREFHELITHFHIADSNRWPPGRGHLRIENQLRLLNELGYTRWISAEVLPKPDNAGAVRDTSNFLRKHGFLHNAPG